MADSVQIILIANSLFITFYDIIPKKIGEEKTFLPLEKRSLSY